MPNDSKRIEVEKYLNEKYGHMDNRDIRFHKNLDAWIDLSYMPKHESGANKGSFNWKIAKGYTIDFKYETVMGTFKVIEYTSKGQYLVVEYNSVRLRPIKTCNFKKVELKGILNDFLVNLDDYYFTDCDNYVDCRELVIKRGVISWMDSIGYSIPFKIDDINGNFIIEDYRKEGQKITLRLNENLLTSIRTGDLIKLKIKNIINDFIVDKGALLLECDEYMLDLRELPVSSNGICWANGLDKNIPVRFKDYTTTMKIHSVNGNIIRFLLDGNITFPICTQSLKRLQIGKLLKRPLSETHSTLSVFFKNEEEMESLTSGSNNIVDLKCPDCGFIKYMMVKRLVRYGFSCDICGDKVSYPNKFIRSMIVELTNHYQIEDIEFEYSPSWAKPYLYDLKFHFNGANYLVEMDGHFHKNQEDNDRIKTEKARINGYTLIRIDCIYKVGNKFSHIRNNVLKSYLGELFDLTLVDFNIIDVKCSNSIQYAVWKEKRENPSIKVSELIDKFKVSKPTILSYLRNGNRLGQCTFVGEDEFYYNKSKGKIYVFKDGVQVVEDYFRSPRDLESKSVELLGVKLYRKTIMGKLNSADYGVHTEVYNGFTFVRVPPRTTLNEFSKNK